ncbi:hypothetical protein [Streptomyces sudanensis]|uniref:hypothetical protein n=1 Tax=Streptomyces sudanensis TaxID=436397 RepID=UPI0020CE99BC|nr:hypothetical protein [Streptomyces sudanensis]MCP9957583.1 hypothetical protein [Streptomyces sudanensis]MCP9986710.1 hypothetical protein [Streptomyces sudanensis]MCQ0001877.1 hypothetical protein [Streptomyces sudanensis]
MNASERSEWLRCFLTDVDVRRLEGVSVPVTPERALGLVELLEGWRNHVLRIEAEIGLPDSDRTVWGAYDLIAALALRSFVSRGMKDIDSDFPGGFGRALDDADSRFMQFTEIDESGTVRRLDGGERSDSEWWWDRVPRIGPIRREVERIESSS